MRSGRAATGCCACVVVIVAAQLRSPVSWRWRRACASSGTPRPRTAPRTRCRSGRRRARRPRLGTSQMSIKIKIEIEKINVVDGSRLPAVLDSSLSAGSMVPCAAKSFTVAACTLTTPWMVRAPWFRYRRHGFIDGAGGDTYIPEPMPSCSAARWVGGSPARHTDHPNQPIPGHLCRSTQPSEVITLQLPCP